MNKDSIAEKAVAAIAKAKGLRAGDIKIEHTFEELGVDSLDTIEILFELEEAFDIAISDEVAKGITSVAQVIESLADELAESDTT